MIQQAIHTVINGRDLDYDTARATMQEMMDGTATDIAKRARISSRAAR